MTSTTGTRRARRPGPARLVGGATAAVLLALVTACGASAATDEGTDNDPEATGGTQSPTVIREATLSEGDAVPLPRGDTVLTLSGKLAGDNKGDTVALDMATLESLQLVRVEMYEPWAKKRLTFGGVELADVLDLAGVDAGATSIHITALDDYEVDLTMDEIRAGGILVATQSGNGHTLPIDKGGPVRVVFRDDVEAGASPDQWIWSLTTIDVR